MQKKLLVFLVCAALIPLAGQAQVSSEDFAQMMQKKNESGIAVSDLDLAEPGGGIPVEQQLRDAVKSINISEAVSIPIRSLKAVKADGVINYISDNGRYILKGELVDVWNYQILNTMDSIKESVDYLRLDRLGKPITDLNVVTLGSTKEDAKEVVAFIGTQSEASKTLINKAWKLSDSYTFQFIPVPAAGAQEAVLTKQIACASDGQDILRAIENNSVSKLKQRSNCDLSTHNETLLAADLMGVTGVPFIVAPNGLISRGLPIDLNQWLKENSN